MARLSTKRIWLLLLGTVLVTFFLIMSYRPTVIVYEKGSIITSSLARMPSQPKTWRGLTKNETDKLSVLGRILYLEEDPPESKIPNEKQFQILVWKYGRTIENRHMKQWGDKFIDPFDTCSVHNCKVTYEDSALETADIVIFHLHRLKPGDLPNKRILDTQIWSFLTDESPYNTFLNKKNNLSSYDGVFNWSMSYRMDSDIPVPYGRTVTRKTPLESDISFPKRRDVLVAVMGSNCGGNNHRWKYINELKKYIKIDIYGGCGDKLKNACKGHFRADCPLLDDYLFYLAFENSNCDEYITEKLWWNAYHKNSIPVVMGATKASYAKLLPPGSYLNIDDYAQPKDLANHILYLNSTGNFNQFYEWKADFEVLNEHGYFQSNSYHYCRICEALNYNDKSYKVYQKLSQFWSKERDCHPAWDAY